MDTQHLMIPDLDPIGAVHSRYRQATGTPVQPGVAQGSLGDMEVFARLADRFRDLGEFDRVRLPYRFDQAAPPHLDGTPRDGDAGPGPCVICSEIRLDSAHHLGTLMLGDNVWQTT